MSKIVEICSECGKESFPTDKAVAFESECGIFPVKLWRYVCGCGWIWANKLQRRHNDKEYVRSRKAAHDHAYYGG